jgi:hypothetical protein
MRIRILIILLRHKKFAFVNCDCLTGTGHGAIVFIERLNFLIFQLPKAEQRPLHTSQLVKKQGETAETELDISVCLSRLRQRKLRGRQNHLEAESYNSAVGKLGTEQLGVIPSLRCTGNRTEKN